MASCRAGIPNEDGDEDKVLLLLELVQECVCKTDDGGPLQEHPDKIRRPKLHFCRINLDEQSRNILPRDSEIVARHVFAELLTDGLNGLASRDKIERPIGVASVETMLIRNRKRQASERVRTAER